VSGKTLLMNEQFTNQLFIFKRNGSNYELHKRIVLKEIEVFRNVCMEFHFKHCSGQPDTLIFTKVDQVFELNFETEQINTVYTFNTPFGKQPQFFMTNCDQSIYIVSNKEDTRHINLKTKYETCVTQACGVTAILKIIYDAEDKKFFIMANKCEYLGLYIVKLDALRPEDNCFIIRWQSKLLNGDGNMMIFRNKQRGLKELIVSYKTIYVLTYNLILLDITTENDPSMIFRHESFQLFESDCSGFFLGKNKDFMHLSKHGM